MDLLDVRALGGVRAYIEARAESSDKSGARDAADAQSELNAQLAELSTLKGNNSSRYIH